MVKYEGMPRAGEKISVTLIDGSIIHNCLYQLNGDFALPWGYFTVGLPGEFGGGYVQGWCVASWEYTDAKLA